MFVDDTQMFLRLCLTAWNEVSDIFDMLMSFWYFRLLFVTGLIWIGFDIFEELSNIEYEDKEEWRK